MFTVYILLNDKLSRTYIGYTSDIEERLKYHNTGKVTATKHLKPWRIIYTENMASMNEAKRREQYWKSGAGRRNIKKILEGFPPNFRKVGRRPETGRASLKN